MFDLSLLSKVKLFYDKFRQGEEFEFIDKEYKFIAAKGKAEGFARIDNGKVIIFKAKIITDETSE